MKTAASMGLLFFVLLLFDPPNLPAYEDEPVTNGGTISGVVKFKGTPPPPKKLQITKDSQKSNPAKVSRIVRFTSELTAGRSNDRHFLSCLPEPGISDDLTWLCSLKPGGT